MAVARAVTTTFTARVPGRTRVRSRTWRTLPLRIGRSLKVTVREPRLRLPPRRCLSAFGSRTFSLTLRAVVLLRLRTRMR